MSKATVNRAELRSALAVLTKCTHPKSTIPVLQHVKLSVNGDVQLAATDLEVSAVFTLERQGRGGEFQALLPAQRFAEYVRKSAHETVTFERQDSTNVRLDGAAAFVGLGIDDFPATLGDEGTRVALFRAGDFAAALRATKYATSNEVVRHALTGILLEVTKQGGSLVASDGKRLSVARIRPCSGRDLREILPWRTVEVLERLTASVDPETKVEVLATFVQATDVVTGKRSETPTVTQLHFKVGNAGVWTRVVEGRFPDWQLVVPRTDRAFTFDRKPMIAEIERVAQACTDKTLAVRFGFGDGKCELYARTPDVGEARGVVSADGKGEVRIVFNPLYVLDFLKALPKGSERVTLNVTDRKSAGVFNATKGHDYVLMPLTITL